VIAKTSAPNRRVLNEFVRWLEDARHVSLGTITVRTSSARVFLETFCRESRSGVAAIRRLAVDDVEDFFVGYCKDHGWAARRSMQSALRLFLQFAAARGWCSLDLVEAVPRLRTYRLGSVPRGIGDEDLGRLLRTKGPAETRARTRALMLLFACYGLRRGQVAALRVDDIDWRARTIRFPAHKAGKLIVHSLTSAVAAALASYLRWERPSSTSESVFLRSCPPFLPLGPSAVTEVVHDQIVRSGITVTPCGPHALRHAFATRLLRAGQPLKAIADLLGHRSLSSTSVYAKVDHLRLLEVATDWPEVLS
jgi:site-specific recombinase XerD